MGNVTRILFVDDEQHMLSALSRVFRAKQFAVATANSASIALEMLKQQPADIIVSDMRMPEMDGAAFLSKCVSISPTSRRILLTGYSDQESTVRAINEGKIHQYLAKPWDNDKLKQVIENEIAEQIRTIATPPQGNEHAQLTAQVKTVRDEVASAYVFADMARDELLSHYATTIKVISNLINARLPSPTIMNADVVRHSVALGKLIKLDHKAIAEISNAAHLYQLGKYALSDEIKKLKIIEIETSKDKRISEQYKSHCIKGADLLTPLSSLHYTAKLIRHQNENVDGTGYPSGFKDKEIPLGSRLLRIVVDYQQLIHGLYLQHPYSAQDSLDYMGKFSGKRYDSILLSLYKKFIQQLSFFEGKQSDRLYKLNALHSGLIVSRDVFNLDGILLISKGSVLNTTTIRKLHELAKREHSDFNVFIQQETNTIQ